MALQIAYYLTTREIAIRSGVIKDRYRTVDGRYILDNKDLSRIRFTTEEYIEGLKGVELIDELKAKTLIAEGGYKMGYDGLDENAELEQQAGQEETQVQEESSNPTEENAEESVNNENNEQEQEEE